MSGFRSKNLDLEVWVFVCFDLNIWISKFRSQDLDVEGCVSWFGFQDLDIEI